MVANIDEAMVVSEMSDTENYYMSGDDDSGFDKNSKITLPLVKGRNYLIHLRVLFTPAERSGGMMGVKEWSYTGYRDDNV